MKPVSLCLVHLGAQGLELIKAYPDVLPEEITNQVILKSMPMGAKPGDFLTANIDANNFSGYVFQIPSKDGRDNLASLVAVYETENYNPNMIKKMFSFTLEELQKNQLVDIKTISKILPEMYNGIAKGHLKIKISSIVMLEFTFESEEKQKNKTQEIVSNVKNELWR